MKLYTEEQVRIAIDIALNGINQYYTPIIDRIKPIELPSDEEMGVIALNIASTLKDGLDSREEAFYLAGFQTCAKWMKEQILNQNQ